MIPNSRASARWTRKRQRGQAILLVAFSMVVLLGFAGLVIDYGRVYVAFRQLQASTDAAALAGAQAMPNSTAVSIAQAYAGSSGNQNAYPNLPNVKMVTGFPKLGCVSVATIPLPPCPNAIQVRQQVSVPTYFAALFGTKSVPLTATATGAMRGAARSPYNVAVVLDSTASMNNSDNSCGHGMTRLGCALQGVQVFLKTLSPCGSSQSSCGSATGNSSGGGANVQNPVDKVSLFTYPPVSTSTAPNDYNCGHSSPTIVKYQYNPFPSSSTYQIVNFSSDYRSSDTATTLNGSSNIVDAVGGKSGCSGMQAIGGVGTYFAQAVQAAQASLVAVQTANPNTQNVLIVLSDGDANATSSNMPGANTTSATYPSVFYQCHEAIGTAQAASAAGILVYSVAYGAATSGGCTTDNTKPPACSSRVTTNCLPAPTAAHPITPCQTMQQMATSPASTYFFSDSPGCTGRGVANLNQIFTDIAGDLTVSRLVPDSGFTPD